MANRHVTKPTVVIDMKTLEVISFIAPEELAKRIVREGEIPHKSEAALTKAIQTTLDHADRMAQRSSVVMFGRYELVQPLVPPPTDIIEADHAIPVYLVDLASGEWLLYPSSYSAGKLNGLPRGAVWASASRFGFPYRSRYSAYTDQELMEEFLEFWYNQMATKKPLFLRKPNVNNYHVTGWTLTDAVTDKQLESGPEYAGLLKALQARNVNTTMRALVCQAYALRMKGLSSFVPRKCPKDAPVRVTFTCTKRTHPKEG